MPSHQNFMVKQKQTFILKRARPDEDMCAMDGPALLPRAQHNISQDSY